MKTLPKDKRPIESVHKGDRTILVGTRGVTKIVVYEELGQGSYVPWLAVYAGDHLQLRLDAAGCAIGYGDPVPEPAPAQECCLPTPPVVRALRDWVGLVTTFIPLGERMVYIYVHHTLKWYFAPLSEWADDSTPNWVWTVTPAWASHPDLACLLPDE